MMLHSLRKEREKRRPYGSIAALYLWHSHDNSKEDKQNEEMIA